MDLDVIFKIAAIGIIVTVVNQILSKNGREDMATMVTLVGVIAVLLIVIEIVSAFFTTLRTTFQIF